MEQKDNSVVNISTLKYEKYEIKATPLSLICYGTKKIEESKNLPFTKLQVFKDMIKLGERLYNQFPNIKISSEITQFIDTDRLDDDSLKISFKDYFPNIFFEDIINKVSNSKEAKEDIINWLNIYGLPTVDESIYFSFNHNLENINNNNIDEVKSLLKEVNDKNLLNSRVSSNKTISKIPDEEDFSKPLDKKSLEILSKYQEYDVDYTNRLLNGCSCDILPLVNCSLMFYLIFTLQNIIGQLKFKFIEKAIKPFPYLTEKHYELNFGDKPTDEGDKYCNTKTEKVFLYDTRFGIIVNNYIKKLIKILNNYIPDVIGSRDTYTINYNDLDLIVEKEDIPDVKKEGSLPNLLQIDYQMRSPILTTFDYLVQILPLKNFKSYIYYCNNCNEIMSSDETLCISCKLSIGKHYINYYTNKGKLEKVKLIEEEISSINKYGIVKTPTILKLYRDNRDQRNTYIKHGKKKKK